MVSYSVSSVVRRFWRFSFGLFVLAAACFPAKAATDIYVGGPGFIITRTGYPGTPFFWEYTSFKNMTGVDAYDFHFYFTDASGKQIGDTIKEDLVSPLPSGQSFVPTKVIKDNGDIGVTGYGFWTDKKHKMITSSVPEPSSLSLLLTGVIVLSARFFAPCAKRLGARLDRE